MTAYYPLSHAQKRLYILHKLFPKSRFYNITLTYSVQGKLNFGALQQSLNILLERHHNLRAQFIEIDGAPAFTIRPVSELPLSVVSLEAASQKDKREAESLDEVNQPFDLQTDLLIRARVVHLTSDRCSFILVLHHIITDMWSMDILCQELSALYNALCRSQQPELPSLAMQYHDYTLWENSGPHVLEQRKHEAFWRAALTAGCEFIDLPYDKPRADRPGNNGSIERITIRKRTLGLLRALAKESRTTLFTLLLSAYAVLLHRLSGQQRLPIGAFFANRHRSEFRYLIGLLFHDLPILVELTDTARFQDFLRETGKAVLDTFAHADYPLDELVKATEQRGNARWPLYNVSFQLYVRNEKRLTFDGTEVHQRRTFEGAKFDLMLYGAVGEDSLDLWFNYNTDLFESDTIKRFLKSLNTLLQSIVEAPDAPIAELDILGPAERRKIVHGFNETVFPYPRSQSIGELFALQSHQTPGAVALSGLDRNGRQTSYTYETLSRRVNQTARFLRSLDLGARPVVGVLLDRTLEMVIADLAILKAGCICLLLDVNYPVAYLGQILEHAQADLILTEPVIAGRLLAGGGFAWADINDLQIDAENGDDLPAYPSPESPAFVVYTSGSTGQSKGVVLSHRGVVNQVYNRRVRLGLQPDDTLCISLSVAFSAMPLQLLSPLLNGCRLIVYPQEVVANPHQLFSRVSHDGVCVVEVTVSMLNVYLSWLQDVERPVFSKLRIVLTAGEKLSPVVVERFYRILPEQKLMTTYGQSECTGVIAVGVIPNEAKLARIIEGRPSINNQFYVLDQHLNPVLPEVLGTVYFSGDSVALGYLHDQEATQKTFIPNPFLPGQIMVNTGDIGKLHSDGRLEVLGRSDDIVKVRGSRVELNRIANVVCQHMRITGCIIGVREHERYGAELVAYYTAQQESFG